MDKVTRYEWHGNSLILTLLVLFVITIPIAIVYFVVYLVKIEMQVPDAGKFSEHLADRMERNS